ncbi:hypothetical protein, partial [Bacteroides sp.]|uniref:hypothetical protein n=1 Tax=Bacteroides sp. TaxID=29523 RepID=UPI00258DF529
WLLRVAQMQGVKMYFYSWGAFYSMEYALKLIISGNAIDSVKDKFEHYKKESFLTVMRINTHNSENFFSLH